MRRLFDIAACLATVCIMMSCELETSSDGNLYGFWHLESIDTIDGGIKDMSDELIFWSVQSNLIECSDRNYQYSPVLFRFERDGDRLLMGHAYYNLRESGDPEVTDVTRLEPFGLYSLEPVYDIDRLKTNKLTLTGEGLRLNFKKL